jgi:hypothetical protein
MDEHDATSQTARRLAGAQSAGGATPRLLGPLARFPLLLGALAGLAVCLVGALALTVLRGSPSASLSAPNAVAQRICTDVLRQEYADLYGLLSTAQQETGTEAQFEASQRQLDAASGQARQCTATVSTIANGRAGVQLTVVRGQAGAAVGSGSLAYESGSWRLDTYDASVV